MLYTSQTCRYLPFRPVATPTRSAIDTDSDALFARPYLTAGLPGLGGRLKAEPEDFLVEEIPAYTPSGEGQHLFVWVEKRGRTSPQMVDALARHFGVPARDIGIAGMKDRHALTRQWASLPAHLMELSDPSDVVGEVDESIRILDAGLHGNKLRTGHLHGNRFRIRLRDLGVDAATAEARLADIFEVLRGRGIPNYYGSQRFGRDRQTVDLGLGLLRGDAGVQRKLKRNKRLKRLAVSALQSAVFNRVLAARIEAGTADCALDGDRLEWFTSRRTLDVNPDTIAEAQELIGAFEAGITGPMPGPRIYPAEAEARAIERQAYEAFGVDDQDFAPLGKIAQGTRRHLMIPAPEASYTVESGGAPEAGEAAAPAVELAFSLPSGSYATVVLREISKADGQEAIEESEPNG